MQAFQGIIASPPRVCKEQRATCWSYTLYLRAVVAAGEPLTEIIHESLRVFEAQDVTAAPYRLCENVWQSYCSGFWLFWTVAQLKMCTMKNKKGLA